MSPQVTKGGVWICEAKTERAHAVRPIAKVSDATRNFASTSKSSPFGGAGTPSGVTSFQNKNRRAAYHGRAAGDGMLFFRLLLDCPVEVLAGQRTAHGGAYLLDGTGNHGQIAPSARYGGPGGPRLMGASAHALTVFNSAINGTIIARRFRYDNRFSSEQTVNKKGRVRWTRPGRLLSQPVRLGPALYAGHKPHGDEQHQQR